MPALHLRRVLQASAGSRFSPGSALRTGKWGREAYQQGVSEVVPVSVAQARADPGAGSQILAAQTQLLVEDWTADAPCFGVCLVARASKGPAQCTSNQELSQPACCQVCVWLTPPSPPSALLLPYTATVRILVAM